VNGAPSNQGGLGDLVAAHHVDQDEVISEDPVQIFEIGRDQRGEEKALRGERIRVVGHGCTLSQAFAACGLIAAAGTGNDQ
jgi:hypothetical protein